MRIGFDARCLEEEKISGVGEYSLEILKNLLEADKKNTYEIFSNSWKQIGNRHIEQLKKNPNARFNRFSVPNKILNFCFWYFRWPKIDKMIGGADVFFAPNINFLATSGGCNLVTTFHDLSFERYPGLFAWKTRLWHRYFVNPRRIARDSVKIIAVSESTKKDLEEIYQISPEKILAVPHGLCQDFKQLDASDPKLQQIRKKYALPEKFILYLGNIEPRKNIRSIIAAHKQLTQKNNDLERFELVLAGNVSPLCKKMIEKENVRTAGYIERNDRPYVYSLASIFVYPSFFEGFGLPVLEAMACGTPVVASHNSSIPEVAGAAAILVDADRPTELSKAMETILSDKNLFNKLKKMGTKQSQKFSWKSCALESMPAFSVRSERDSGDILKN